MEKRKISADTVIRTIVLFVALTNQVLTMLGLNPLPFAEEDIYAVVSVSATIIMTIWAWWKNNSFTQEALKADEYLSELKELDIAEEEYIEDTETEDEE